MDEHFARSSWIDQMGFPLKIPLEDLRTPFIAKAKVIRVNSPRPQDFSAIHILNCARTICFSSKEFILSNSTIRKEQFKFTIKA